MPVLEEIFNTFITAVSGRLEVLFVLAVIDLFLATFIAIVKKEFKLEKLPEFLISDGVPIVGWLAAELLLAIPPYFITEGFVLPVLGYVVYATVFAKIAGSILGSIASTGVLTQALYRIGVNRTPSG